MSVCQSVSLSVRSTWPVKVTRYSHCSVLPARSTPRRRRWSNIKVHYTPKKYFASCHLCRNNSNGLTFISSILGAVTTWPWTLTPFMVPSGLVASHEKTSIATTRKETIMGNLHLQDTVSKHWRGRGVQNAEECLLFVHRFPTFNGFKHSDIPSLRTWILLKEERWSSIVKHTRMFPSLLPDIKILSSLSSKDKDLTLPSCAFGIVFTAVRVRMSNNANPPRFPPVASSPWRGLDEKQNKNKTVPSTTFCETRIANHLPKDYARCTVPCVDRESAK